MKKEIAFLLMVTYLVSFNGCATIVSSKRQDVTVRSTPAGADVLIDGSLAGTTPMVANLVRKRRHSLEFKKAGYSDITKATTRGFNWWYLGNLIFGGLIGLIVDPITGAMYTVKPEEVYVDFNAVSGAGAVAPAPAVAVATTASSSNAAAGSSAPVTT